MTGFDARVERAYQQAVRARAAAEGMTELADAARKKLGGVGTIASHPMDELARRLALSAAQVELVWTVVACSVDARLVPHLEALGGAHARRGLSVAVYAMLAELDGRATTALAHWLASPNPLVATELLVATEEVSPAARAYVASPRLVSYLTDTAHAIAPLRAARLPPHLLYDDDQRATLAEIAAVLAGDAVLVVEGPLGAGRVTACAQASDRTLIVLDLERVASAELGRMLVALRCESVLQAAIPVLANVDHVVGEGREQRRVIGATIDAVAGPIVVTSSTPGVDFGTDRPIVRLRWQVASTEVRAAMWKQVVGQVGAAIEDVRPLAHRYRVGPAAIRRAVASARLLRPDGALSEAELIHGLRHNIAERLGGLAMRVEVTQSWDDLVIADDVRDHVSALIGRIRYSQQVLDTWGYRRKIARGIGVPALFSGPPGTGKTMVAGLIARELDLELYQVDLSKVVSKWVGETEKNLGRVFDAAEEGHGLLLFDEADALFGSRTSDIQGANDRYANLEVNYLLQRIEAFDGVTILTTNLETAIDQAFKRRLASHIVFATPEEDERVLLWRRQTTTGTAPLAADVDPEGLARAFPKMTGANIRNAAISAAFLAAGERSPKITHEHLTRAARAEYRSMGHIVTETISRGKAP